MIFRRSKSTSVGRRRLQARDLVKPKTKKFLYRSKRADVELNVGRSVAREQTNKSKSGWAFVLQRIGLLVLLIAILASAVNSLSLSTNPKVLPLDGDKAGAFLHDTVVYENYATHLLSDSVWNRNKITVNTADVSRKLVEKYPELASASVTVPLLAHRPIIYIQPAKPTIIMLAKNGSFVVANTGKALLGADNSSALDKYSLPKLNDSTGLKLAVGKQALTTADVNFIQTVITELGSKGFKVASMNLPVAANELDVQLVGQPYLVKFNLASSTARQQAGTFLSMIGYLQKQNVTPGKYVDVRVNGRAYYQ